MLLLAHHLVVDGMSWRILLEDLSSAFEQLEHGGGDVELPAKTTGFAQWAASLEGEAVATEEGPPDAAMLFEEGDDNNWGDVEEHEQCVELGGRPVDEALLLAALAQTLGQFMQVSELAIDLEGHGRDRGDEGLDLTRTVGWFTALRKVVIKLGATGGGGALESVRVALAESRRQGGASAEVSFNYLGRLEVPEGDSSFLSLNKEGEASLFFIGLPWNPDRYFLTLENGNRYLYDENEGFLQAETPSGATLTATPTGLRHSLGARISLNYDASGRLASVEDPDGLVWKYVYSDRGDLATVTDPDGRATRYTYDQHRLISVKNPFGRTGTVFEYDEDGRLIATVDPEGHRTEFGWDPDAFSGSVVDALGNTTQYVYDARGNVTRAEDPLGAVTEYVYGDARHPDLVTSMTDPNGGVTRYHYNDQGLPEETELPDGSTRIQRWDPRGNLISEDGPDGQKRTYQYDANGQRIMESEPSRPTVRFDRDASGALTKQRDGLGYENSIAYDRNGHRAGSVDSNGIAVEEQRDTKGNLLRQSVGSRSVSLERDAQGRPTALTDSAGHSASMVPDANGDLTYRNREGEAVKYEFEPGGELKRVIQADGEIYELIYGTHGRLARLIYPDRSFWKFEYDALGRVIELVDRAGHAIRTGYDAVGNRTFVVNRNGLKRTFEFDSRNRVIAERWHAVDGAVVREIRMDYHSKGFLEKVTDGDYELSLSGGLFPRANRWTYQYPGQAPFRLLYDWQERGEELSSPGRIRVQNRENRILHDVGAVYSGRLPQQFEAKFPDQSYGRIEWRYSEEGWLSEERRFNQLGAGREPVSISTYGYDHAGQLAIFDHGTEHDRDEAIFQRDAESRIEAIITPEGTTSYQYDVLGQIKSVESFESDRSLALDYDQLRSLIRGPGFSGGVTGPNDQLEETDEEVFSYDPEGNLIERVNRESGEIRRYEYNHLNRVTWMTVHRNARAASHHTVELDYDFRHRLISRTVNGRKTWILYDRVMPIAEFEDGSDELSAAYFYALDRVDHFLGSWRKERGMRWFLNDQIRSVRGLLTGEGDLVAWRDFGTFGEHSAEISGEEPIGFAGRHWNADLRLVENRHRTYDPMLGRFLQQDPVLFRSEDPNLYRYAGNNPLNWRDLWGPVPRSNMPSSWPIWLKIWPAPLRWRVVCSGSLPIWPSPWRESFRRARETFDAFEPFPESDPGALSGERESVLCKPSRHPLGQQAGIRQGAGLFFAEKEPPPV
ncbi:MAG: RHS repeat-associated core domain-containing protein [Verrucomicrobiota bacterium]